MPDPGAFFLVLRGHLREQRQFPVVDQAPEFFNAWRVGGVERVGGDDSIGSSGAPRAYVYERAGSHCEDVVALQRRERFPHERFVGLCSRQGRRARRDPSKGNRLARIGAGIQDVLIVGAVRHAAGILAQRVGMKMHVDDWWALRRRLSLCDASCSQTEDGNVGHHPDASRLGDGRGEFHLMPPAHTDHAWFFNADSSC